MIKKIKNVGFIGTGIIGLPMAKNLFDAGYKIHTFARNNKTHLKLKKAGLIVEKDLCKFYKSIDILILAVSDTIDVKNILTGKNGMG